MILVVDNHGFTSRILAHRLGSVDTVTGVELAGLPLDDYTHIVVGHGTTQPDLQALAELPDVPVLAIGAAYQHLAALYGHHQTATAQPVYGQPVTHRHEATGLFAQLPQPTQLISYHPWRLINMAAETFTVQATDDHQAVLAYRIKETNHYGLHADPAALQSAAGSQLLENFLALTSRHTASAPASPQTVTQQPQVALYTREIHGQLDTAATFAHLQTGSSAAFWLDSSAAHLGQGDTSIMGTNRGPLAQTIRWDVTTNQLDIHTQQSVTTQPGDVLDYLNDHTWQPATDTDLPGFSGGWVGYLGYEAKQTTVADHTNTFQASTPDAYWIRPQAFLRYNHRNQTTTLCAYDDATLLDTLETTLVFGTTAPPQAQDPTPVVGTWRMDGAQYQQRVETIQELLHTGQAAGVCLTDTFSMDGGALDGLALYRRLRAKNPAPYAGYLRFNTFDDNLEILSASPERFLTIDAHGLIESKPIKGTVARSSQPHQDARIAAAMAADPKIQSENLMITDLLRDDIAQVAIPGTVQVPKLMAVETFATVHQLVTTVTGQLRPGLTATQALQAVFPGGSMTGAPKRASLETLETLEAGPRGIYSGTMGWIGHNNTADLNVVIRTIVLSNGRLSIGAGGAVVVDSDPAAEEQEKHLKARALMHSIQEQL